MTTNFDIDTARQLVLARLGAPCPLLPGESHCYRSANRARIYERFDAYIDEALFRDRPEQALEDFLGFLEGERERDYEAFHFGRDLLLNNLETYVELPESDPEPSVAPVDPSDDVGRRKLPRWSRRKPARAKPHQLRARVLGRLGRPTGRLPGEGYMLMGNPALDRIQEHFDGIEYMPITERMVDEGIALLASMRERDWQAFCVGRERLLGLLPCEVELPAQGQLVTQ